MNYSFADSFPIYMTKGGVNAMFANDWNMLTKFATLDRYGCIDLQSKGRMQL